jgi:hypothetical protein
VDVRQVKQQRGVRRRLIPPRSAGQAEATRPAAPLRTAGREHSAALAAADPVQASVNDAQDQSGTRQVTAPGYDTMTGLSTPNGSAFIKDLRSGTKHPTRRIRSARGHTEHL